MFYGFGPPRKDDVIFKLSGELLKIRFADVVARDILRGAVQSTKKDGIRHCWAEFLEKMTSGLVNAIAYCSGRKWLGLFVWLLKPILMVVGRMSIRATNADFNKRTFVADEDGNYTMMFRNPNYEHIARTALEQLGVKLVSEHFPPDAYRSPKPERMGTFTHEFTIAGHHVKVDLS